MGGLFKGGHHAHRSQFAFPETQLHPRRARNRPSRHCRAGCRGSRAARSKEAKLSGPGMGTAPVLEYRGRGAWRRRGLGDFDTSHREFRPACVLSSMAQTDHLARVAWHCLCCVSKAGDFSVPVQEETAAGRVFVRPAASFLGTVRTRYQHRSPVKSLSTGPRRFASAG